MLSQRCYHCCTLALPWPAASPCWSWLSFALSGIQKAVSLAAASHRSHSHSLPATKPQYNQMIIHPIPPMFRNPQLISELSAALQEPPCLCWGSPNTGDQWSTVSSRVDDVATPRESISCCRFLVLAFHGAGRYSSLAPSVLVHKQNPSVSPVAWSTQPKTTRQLTLTAISHKQDSP